PRKIEVAVLDAGTAPAVQFHDALGIGAKSISDPLLFPDPDGNVWLAFKRRYSRAAYRPSTYWETYLTHLDGDRWTLPIPRPYSWTRKSTRMGLAASGGRLWAFWPSESRKWAFASRPLANRVIAGSLRLPGRSGEPVLLPSRAPERANDSAAIRERGDVD